MSNTQRKTKYECLGGPICGRMMRGVKSEIGVPCFAWEEDDGERHFYRLAKSSSGVKYWHYLGTLGINKEIRPFMRPSPHDA